MTTWNNAFEQAPSDLDFAEYGAQEIRVTRSAVNEREELEHNFRAGTRPYHKAGQCSVVYVGTTSDIAALTSVSAGCTAYDTALGVWKVYDGTAWTERLHAHGKTTGLGNDDHPQYLHLNKNAIQEIQYPITVKNGVTIDGRDVSVDGTALDTVVSTVAGMRATVSGKYNPITTPEYDLIQDTWVEVPLDSEIVDPASLYSSAQKSAYVTSTGVYQVNAFISIYGYSGQPFAAGDYLRLAIRTAAGYKYIGLQYGVAGKTNIELSGTGYISLTAGQYVGVSVYSHPSSAGWSRYLTKNYCGWGINRVY